MNRVSYTAMIAMIVVLPLGVSVRRASLVEATAPAAALLNPNHDCAFCHDLHTAPGQTLATNAVVETLCMTCHGPAGTSTLKAEVHSNKNGSSHAAFSMTCVDCHDPHDNVEFGNAEGGTNLRLVLEQIATPNSGTMDVVFESRGPDWGGASLHSFADTDEDNDGDLDGVCEVCHTLTLQHTNANPNPHHSTGATCTSCHPHDEKFLGTGGACDQCHNTPRGSRREVVSEFSRTSHHLQGTLDVADCVMCHDQSQHQQGNVSLWDVDDPGNTAASTVLSADPNTSSSEASLLASFCLACHDADGASGDTTPFSDGISVPAIDGTLWTVASHNSTAPVVSCYGDGAFGCHASGHGSEKIRLLAPSTVTATAPDSAEQEEGFCFNCHDADGPSTMDIQSLFARAIRWITAPVRARPDTTSVRNDRHDVQYTGVQEISGAKVECVDCHDPHSATSGRPFRTDPDPGNSHVPGTDWYFADYQAVGDIVSEFCLDCHDGGGFPTGVLGPNVSGANDTLTNIVVTDSSDGMGAGGGNASLKSGYGWGDDDHVPCLSCHNPHVSNNLFHAVEEVRSEDGSTSVPTDGGGTYEFTDNNIQSPPVNGWNWCNTCHSNSMGMGHNRDNCFECHYHGRRW